MKLRLIFVYSLFLWCFKCINLNKFNIKTRLKIKNGEDVNIAKVQEGFGGCKGRFGALSTDQRSISSWISTRTWRASKRFPIPRIFQKQRNGSINRTIQVRGLQISERHTGQDWKQRFEKDQENSRRAGLRSSKSYGQNELKILKQMEQSSIWASWKER